MGTRDARVDVYIDRSAGFAKPILHHLRRVVHAASPDAMEESIKWGFPHFMYKGLLCSMAGFTHHCAFAFWRGSLIFGGGTGVAAADAMGQFGRLTDVSDLPEEAILVGYVRDAVRLNESGIKAPARAKPKERQALVIPAPFMAALQGNDKALATFESLSYSHKKEYVEWIVEAKREATRQKRMATALDWLAEGKSRNSKYMKR